MVATVRFKIDGDLYRFEMWSYETPEGERYKLVLSEHGGIHSDQFSDIDSKASLISNEEIIEAMEDMTAYLVPNDSQAVLNDCFEQFAENTDGVESVE